MQGRYFRSEFPDFSTKNGRGKTIVEIKNFICSGGCRFHIKIQVRDLKKHKSTYDILFRDNTEKMWPVGIFEFCPQNRVRGPQIWGAKIILLLISPPILDSESKVFGP